MGYDTILLCGGIPVGERLCRYEVGAVRLRLSSIFYQRLRHNRMNVGTAFLTKVYALLRSMNI